MATRKILTIGDELLRKQAKKVEKFDQRLWTLLEDMAQTMYEAPGVGLAAPQVGILRQVVVIDTGEEESKLLELVNPRIIAEEGVQCGAEGCLSVPGRQALVTRPQKVRVEAMDRHGKVFTIEGEDFLAQAICHELDHLKGQLYVDIMDQELFAEDDWEEVLDKVLEKKGLLEKEDEAKGE
ncbi:MAG: peptide deformylase [Clostridiales bacterium]|nr:peptide deformylase [Clostridiales bacterium]